MVLGCGLLQKIRGTKYNVAAERRVILRSFTPTTAPSVLQSTRSQSKSTNSQQTNHVKTKGLTFLFVSPTSYQTMCIPRVQFPRDGTFPRVVKRWDRCVAE